MHTFRKLPSISPNRAPKIKWKVRRLSGKGPLIAFKRPVKQCLDTKKLLDSCFSAFPQTTCDGGILSYAPDSFGYLGGIVVNVQPRFVVDEDFGQSIDMAGHHRYPHAHCQQCRRAEPF